jgi:peptidoglycan/xylan/chitin deacetylase (PgdA/CDA1 family)
MTPLKALKRVALGGMNAAGVYRMLANSTWRRKRLLILCYHGISLEDEHRWRPSLFMDRDTFAQRLALLRKTRCNVLPLGEAVERLYACDLPPRSVAITFDDGNYDFYHQAFPLLQQFGYPSTVYLHSYYCVNPYPVFGLIRSYMLWKRRGAVIRTHELCGAEIELDLRTAVGRSAAEALLTQLNESQPLSVEGKDEFARRLAAVLDVDYGRLRAQRVLHIMSQAEIAEVAAAGVNVELHTHRHISPRDEALYREQIRSNREVIEGATGRRPSHFCYPSGNHRPEFLPWLEREGVRSATTCTPGLAGVSSHPLLLPRMIDHGDISSLEFEGWVSGAASILPNRHYATRAA